MPHRHDRFWRGLLGDNGFEYDEPEPPRRSLAVRPQAEPIPPVYTRDEIQAARKARAALAYLDGIAAITSRIAKLSPGDPDTYSLLLRVRESYVQEAERAMASGY